MSTALERSQPRSVDTAYLLWMAGLFGACGVHRIYMGRWVSGIIWLATGGLCGIGQVVDLFVMPRMIRDANDGRDVW